MEETDKERRNRELGELLNELRVALPGIQVLFAFMLTVPFSGSFGRLTDAEKAVYMAAFLATAIATVLFLAPTAYHRLRFREGDKEQILRTSNRLALAGLVFLMFALSAVVYLVSELVISAPVAAGFAAALAAFGSWLWFGLPITRALKEP
jgi:phosphatidylserine synthase